MKLRAFNLARGLVANFNGAGGDVILGVYRDSEGEQVTVVTQVHGDQDSSGTMVHQLDFNDEVLVTGVCVNPDDLDDCDYGSADEDNLSLSPDEKETVLALREGRALVIPGREPLIIT